MVQLSTSNREIRGDGGHRHEKLGLERSSCASQFTIPDTGGTNCDLVGNTTDTRSPKPNQASSTPDFSGLLVSSISVSSSSTISLFLVHNSTIIARTQSYVILLYLSMPSSWVNTKCSIHRVQHTLSAAYTKYSIHREQHTPSTVNPKYSIYRVQHIPSTAYTEYSTHWVQHTPSTAYTEYSIYQVQHTPSTAYTEYSIHQVQHTPTIVCRPLILTILSWPLYVASASGVLPYRSTATSQFSIRASKVKSPRHIPTVVS